MLTTLDRSSVRLTGGTELAFVTAGDERRPTVLLLHGFPSSADTFRDVVPVLADVARVVVPDLPGSGRSDVVAPMTFDACAAAVGELLTHLDVGERYVYLHDWGAPVGLRLAMNRPDLLRGLIIQNANAHRSGFGPPWEATLSYWADPNPTNEAEALSFLSSEGVRDQYVAGVPDDVARQISPAVWTADWQVMCRPGRREAQAALLRDYGRYVERFDEISSFLRAHQPPALMVWGRHDVFFELDETVSWMRDLPRMEAHVLDGGHFLLETHAQPAAALMRDFVERTAG